METNELDCPSRYKHQQRFRRSEDCKTQHQRRTQIYNGSAASVAQGGITLRSLFHHESSRPSASHCSMAFQCDSHVAPHLAPKFHRGLHAFNQLLLLAPLTGVVHRH